MEVSCTRVRVICQHARQAGEHKFLPQCILAQCQRHRDQTWHRLVPCLRFGDMHAPQAFCAHALEQLCLLVLRERLQACEW